MGPGGLRGLQILRSGVQSARGGFDSHAFPPLFRALIAAVVLAAIGVAPAAAAARADAVAAAAADSLAAAHADSLAQVMRPDSAAAARPDSSFIRTVGPARTVVPPPGRFDNPNWVMMRSLVVPGWGQAHNGKWIKAGIVATTEGLLIASVAQKSNHLDELNAQVQAARAAGDIEAENAAVIAYNAQLSSLTASEWWLGAAVVYALLDAYIDAHFRGFDIEFKNDPALPGGKPPREARLSLRWSW